VVAAVAPEARSIHGEYERQQSLAKRFAAKYPQLVMHRQTHFDPLTGVSKGETITVSERNDWGMLEHHETVELPMVVSGDRVLATFADWLETQL
jgi:hypothetical protein